MKNPKSITELKKNELVQLAMLSSSLHKDHWGEKAPKHLGLKHEYKTLKVHKNIRKFPHTKFHVVRLFSNKKDKACGQCERIFVANFQYRNVFSLYNILENGDLIEVTPLFQDSLFHMHKYLIECGYNI